MVYNIQNCWASSLCPSSGILNTRNHNVSETGSVSILRWGGGGGGQETPTQLGPLERANLNTLFWKLDLLTSLDEERETSILLGPLERAILNHHHITTAIQKPDTRLSWREVTEKYAVKIAVKHAESGTMIKMEAIIFVIDLSCNQVTNTHITHVVLLLLISSTLKLKVIFFQNVRLPPTYAVL
jgi:hypothetical protein